MAAVGRRLPPVLFLLPALLLLFSLDGGAAEGGGLRPSSPGDNGHPAGPDPVPTAGNLKATSPDGPGFI